MTRNISRPAERERGLRFLENFWTIEDVYDNGGTITGTKAEYPEILRIKTVIAKLKAVDTGSNTVKLNSSTTITITAGNVFESYSNATAFDLDDFEVDDYSKFEYIRCFSEELTDEEISGYENGTTFTYIKEADVNLPMNLDRHDPDNTRTLDVSGNANHAEVTGAVKESYKGYAFDGTDDYGEIQNFTLDSSSESFSVACWAKCEDASDTASNQYIISQAKTLDTYSSDWFLGGYSVPNNYVAWFRTQNIGLIDPHLYELGCHIAMTYNNTTGVAKAYINGEYVDEATISSNAGMGTVKIGTRGDATLNFFEGNVKNIFIKKEVLTDMQIKDLYVNQLGREI